MFLCLLPCESFLFAFTLLTSGKGGNNSAEFPGWIHPTGPFSFVFLIKRKGKTWDGLLPLLFNNRHKNVREMQGREFLHAAALGLKIHQVGIRLASFSAVRTLTASACKLHFFSLYCISTQVVQSKYKKEVACPLYPMNGHNSLSPKSGMLSCSQTNRVGLALVLSVYLMIWCVGL